MSTITIFIQAQGRTGIAEAEVAAALTAAELHAELARLGFAVTPETFVFIDDAEDHVQHGKAVHGLKHGCRVHVAHCQRIKTMVHFLDRSIEHAFPPGTRVRAVKAWVVHKLKMTPTDAAEHVLQLCKSTDRPAGDTPLHELVHGYDCAVCFDFVPEKRVEG